MSLRRVIVEAETADMNVTEFCRLHGISTWFFWDLRRRYAIDGEAVLEPTSRAPKRVANKTPTMVEDAIVAKRKELLDAGLDAGPGTIAFHLRDLDGVPSEATIWRILKARGFITPDPSKAPKRTGRRFTAERANDCWQLDDTFWRLADDTTVKIFNVIDDHSRLLVASTAMAGCTAPEVLGSMADAAVVLGWPARFLSDNAKTFRYTLADAMAQIGVAAGHSRPYHPQTCGKVERFHQTLKRWLDGQPRAQTLDELQALLDVFRHIYNHQRPHRSLDKSFPAEVWANAPKSGPSDRPLNTPTAVYRSVVHNGLCDAGNRYCVTIGARYNRQSALLVITGTACHVFVDGHLVRALTLDPTRRHQRLYNRPGRPSAPTVREDPRHP